MFTYEDGDLLWLAPTSNRTPVGTPAGTIDSKGYYSVRIGGKKHMNHRIIWELHNGPIPEGYVIDHIDRNPGNNRIENLRLATRQQNAWNAKANGFCYIKSRGKYVARLNQKHLGYFNCPTAAKFAYEKAATSERGEYHNG